MTTSDGIADKDWAEVEDLARLVAEATFRNDDHLYASAVDELLTQLRILQSRYGSLPSILATMADYTEDDREAIRLLENAYFVADQLHDRNPGFRLLQYGADLLHTESLLHGKSPGPSGPILAEKLA